jgi:hypothetical protein
MFRKSLAKYVVMSILSLACIGSTLGQAASGDDFKAQIETLRKSLEKYQDYKVAVRDLYLSTVACVLFRQYFRCDFRVRCRHDAFV